jgi:hypothetical protein
MLNIKDKFNSIAKPKIIPDLQFKPYDARESAEKYGAKWSAMIELFENDMLSFDPETNKIETQEQSYEWDFLARLTAPGCSVQLLKEMLKGLDKPYVYELKKIYYDWTLGVWKTIPKLDSLAAFVESASEDTWDDDDILTLYDLRDSIDSAIEVMNEEIEEGLRGPKAEKDAE